MGFSPGFLKACELFPASEPPLVAVSHTDMLLMIAPNNPYVSKIERRKDCTGMDNPIGMCQDQL